MSENVDRFIEWWTSLSPEERRRRIEESKIRRAYWMERRARVLFGLLESDSLFGILETTELVATIPTDKKENTP